MGKTNKWLTPPVAVPIVLLVAIALVGLYRLIQ